MPTTAMVDMEAMAAGAMAKGLLMLSLLLLLRLNPRLMLTMAGEATEDLATDTASAPLMPMPGTAMAAMEAMAATDTASAPLMPMLTMAGEDMAAATTESALLMPMPGTATEATEDTAATDMAS